MSTASRFVCLLLLGLQTALPQCRNIGDAVLQSFVSKRADPKAFQELLSMGPQRYRAERFNGEAQQVQQLVAKQIPNSPHLAFVRQRMSTYYQIAGQLYGSRLDANRSYVLPDMDLNAFATGNHIFVLDGILLYYTKPIEFLSRVKAIPPTLTREQYNRVAAAFPWRDDYDSLSFVMAHEAAHNIMMHQDESIIDHLSRDLGTYEKDAKDYRAALAEGRRGLGLTHSLTRGFNRFMDNIDNSKHQVGQEEEADAIAMEILTRAGLRPESGIQWLERMNVLLGQKSSNIFTSLNSMFCSTHPDHARRLTAMQRQLGCLRQTGRLCENHISYPIGDRFQQMTQSYNNIGAYNAETAAIAENRSTSNARGVANLQTYPSGARMWIDGRAVTGTSLQLGVGAHTLTLAAAGHRPGKVTFLVFPDVPANVRVGLRRCGNTPCENDAPEELRR